MADTAALVVALSAQLSSFQKDMDEANGIAAESVKKIESTFKTLNPDASGAIKRFSDSAEGPAIAAGSGIGTAVLVGFTGAIAGIVLQVGHIIDALAKIGDRAEDLRLPVNLLQALSVAADQARLPQEKLNQALDNFTETTKKNKKDAEDFYFALRQVGKGFEDAFNKAPTQQAKLKVISDALAETKDEAKRAQLQLKAFGTDSEKIAAVLGQGAAAFDETRQRLKAMGLEIDESAVKKAQQASTDLALLSRIITDQFSSSLASLIPTLTSLLPLMERLGGAFRDIIAGFSDLEKRPTASLQNLATQTAEAINKIQTEMTALDAAPQKGKFAEWLEGVISGATEQVDKFIGITDKIKGSKLPQPVIDWILDQLGDTTTTAQKLEARQNELARLRELQTATSEAIIEQGRFAAFTAAGAKKAFPERPAGPPKAEAKDPFEAQVDSINRHIAALNADAAAVGLTEAAHQGLRTELALLQSIERSGGEVTQEQIDRYSILRASMTQQQALTAAGINLNKEHADTFQSVSDRMLTAAGRADELKRAYLGVQSAISFGGNQLIDIMDALRTKTQSASEAMRSLTNNLLKALEQALLLGQGPLAGILGTASKFSGGTGGILGALFSSFGTAGGGTGGIGHAQHGGPVSAGRPYVVGEHGPELFVPGASGHIVPNAISGGRGGGSMVEINNYVAADTETRQQRQEGPNGERVIIDIVKKAQARGDLDDVNRGRFGLRPAKVR